MTLNLIADRIVKGQMYPALAVHQAEPYTQSWREFDQHWPYTVPFRLQEYCEHNAILLNVLPIDSNWPINSWYPIGLGFFDFTIDYFALLPKKIFSGLKKQQIKILFYYHEGDDPYDIKQRLNELCYQHQLISDCYVFVSANTKAKNILGFVYFTDFELWYYQRNRTSEPTPVHTEPRQKDFTVLNRLHKSWRASAMADLQSNHILDNSIWSYCESGQLDSNNPLEVNSSKFWLDSTINFLNSAPYTCDELDQHQRNSHDITVKEHYTNSYCSIVMETHFDLPHQGIFLTEKTFKPIKHGHLFFVAGPAGSLQILRDLGYQVFDSFLDNRYDLELDATRRWKALLRSIYFVKNELPQIFKLCQDQIIHNQQLFHSVKTGRLNKLIEDINEYC